MYEIVALIEINARVTQMQEINVLVEPDPGVSATAQLVRVEEIITVGQLQDIVQGSFRVPEDKPGIERILDVGAEVVVVETKILDGQAVIEADAHLQFMYVALKDSQPVHHMHHRYHFTKFVPLPDLAGKYRQIHARDLHVNVQDVIEYLTFDTHGPDTARVELVMAFTVIVTKTRDIDIVTAITDSTAPTYQVQTLTLEQVVGEAHNQILVTDDLRVPEEKPGAQQLLDLKIIRIHIPRDEIVLLNDKVVLGGVIHLKAIYVGLTDKGDQPVHAMEGFVKFRGFIPIPGTLPEMTAHVNAILEHTTGHVHAPDFIRVEVVLQLIGRVVVTSQIDTVLCPTVSLPPSAPRVPGAPTTAPCPFTVTIQPGDTIFNFAMQYHVSMDHIIAANPGIDPNNLVVGAMLTIPCDP
jgi:LysM repeat protein